MRQCSFLRQSDVRNIGGFLEILFMVETFIEQLNEPGDQRQSRRYLGLGLGSGIECRLCQNECRSCFIKRVSLKRDLF